MNNGSSYGLGLVSRQDKSVVHALKRTWTSAASLGAFSESDGPKGSSMPAARQSTTSRAQMAVTFFCVVTWYALEPLLPSELCSVGAKCLHAVRCDIVIHKLCCTSGCARHRM